VKGILRGLRGEDVLVETDLGAGKSPGELAVPYTSIGEAKLLLTDELIQLDLKRRKQAEKAAKPR
jgi:ribosome maturation factor RimP